jgi:hypothetical protein
MRSSDQNGAGAHAQPFHAKFTGCTKPDRPQEVKTNKCIVHVWWTLYYQFLQNLSINVQIVNISTLIFSGQER